MSYEYPSAPKVCGNCGGQATRIISDGSVTHGYSCVKCYDRMLDILNLGSTPHETHPIAPRAKTWRDAETELKRNQAAAVATAERIIRESWLRNNGMCPPEPAP